MKKLLANLIVLSLLICSLAACNSADSTSKNDSQAASSKQDNTSTASGADSQGEKDPYAHLKGINLGGRNVTILVEDNGSTRYMSREILPYEKNPDIINTAITARNNKVETLLNCKLVEVRANSTTGDTISIIRNEIMGTSTYDLVMPYMPAAAALAADGAFLDLKTQSDIIKLDNNYWDDKAVKDLSIGGKVFFATGDFSLLTFDCTHAIVFNKTVVTQNPDLEDPYKLLNEGKWTFDALYKNAKLVTAEADGIDGMTWEDKWGFFMNTNFATSMFVGAGARLTSKNSDDLPYITLKTEKASTIIDKLVTMVNDKSSTIIIESDMNDLKGKYDNVYTAATASFAENRALFRALAIVDLNELQVYKEANYGLLPIPKFNEAQENYHNIVSAVYASCFAIPTQVADPKGAAAVAEALAISSTDTVRKQYYEVLLKGRQIADADGEKALDLIFNNRVYEMGTIYIWGTLSSIVYDVVLSGSNTLESKLSTTEDQINEAIKATIDAFSNN
ncbi:MAG: hypothetical protein RRY76_04275 [Clostridia bacterium]